MARKFKCRNGTILEEKFTKLGDDYICLYDPTGTHKKGETVSLLSGRRYGKQYSIGGAYGGDYDIVEELKPKKQRKLINENIRIPHIELTKDAKLELLVNTIKSLGLDYTINTVSFFGTELQKIITVEL